MYRTIGQICKSYIGNVEVIYRSYKGHIEVIHRVVNMWILYL